MGENYESVMEKTTSIKTLRWVYLIIFLVLVGMIILLHAIPKPFLDIIRMPTFIRAAEASLGFPYAKSLLIYQITLLFFVFVILIDAVSLFLFSSNLMKKISAYSSVVGFTLMAVVSLYFLYSLMILGLASSLIQTIVIYLVVSIFLMILDLYTFEVDEEQLKYTPILRGRKL